MPLLPAGRVRLFRPLPADKIEHRKSVLVGDDRFAVDKAREYR